MIIWQLIKVNNLLRYKGYEEEEYTITSGRENRSWLKDGFGKGLWKVASEPDIRTLLQAGKVRYPGVVHVTGLMRDMHSI